MSDLVPSSLPISTACYVCGMGEVPFRRDVLAPGFVELDERGKVTRASLERFIGVPLTAERYLTADRRRDDARRRQREYDHRQKEAANGAL